MDDNRFNITGKRFWRGAFSEADGTPSSSRILSAFLTVMASGWVSLIVWAHIKHPYEPILPDLAGLAFFIGVPYGINKGNDAIGKIVSVYRTNVNGDEKK